jgi:ketopantoate reductase
MTEARDCGELKLRGSNDAMPPHAGTSMLDDRPRGDALEHEALIGAVVEIGAEHGVATPVSSALFSLLRAVSGHRLPLTE